MLTQKDQAALIEDVDVLQRTDTIHNAEQRKCKQSQCGNISLGQPVHIQFICTCKFIYILFYIGTEQTDVADSYMGGTRFKPCPGYDILFFLWFAPIPPHRCWDNTSTRPWHLPSASFPIQHSPIILPIDGTQSEQLAASYNKPRNNSL
jgi:hypothetical protein